MASLTISKSRYSAAGAETARKGTPSNNAGTANPVIAPRPKRKPDGAASAANRNMVFSPIAIYRAAPAERIEMIRSGVPATEVKKMFAEVAVGQAAAFKALNYSTATVNKKAKRGEALSREGSERFIGFARLVGQVEAIIEEAGTPAGFDARGWIARWLTEPLPAFGGTRPLDFLDTMEGQQLVSAALAKVQGAAYA